jgi:hypothetical protein
MLNEGPVVLLNDLVQILCLHVFAAGQPLALANPQPIHFTTLLFQECGTKAAHENCDITVTELPLANLLKTGLDAGVLTGEDGTVLVDCENIDIIGTDIECTYDTTGFQFTVGAQHFAANETRIDRIGETSRCPVSMDLDALLVSLANRYVLA